MRNRLAMVVGGALAMAAWLYAAAAAPVAEAAMQGDRDAVKALLKQAADVNGAQGDGMTALHWAAIKNDAELAATLLYAGANVRAKTRLGDYTPLILAARSGNAAVLDPLIKAGADVNSKTSNGTTALMLAAASGSVEAVQALVNHGADIMAVEPVRGLNAAMFAAASNRAAVITFLAKHGADLKATTKIVDLNAIDRSSFGGILFGNPAPPPAPGQTAAQAAAGLGQGQPNPQAGRNFPGGRGMGKAGIDRQYQLNELVSTQGGMTPLLFAARQGYMESAQALISAGVDVNQVSAGDKASPLLTATLRSLVAIGTASPVALLAEAVLRQLATERTSRVIRAVVVSFLALMGVGVAGYTAVASGITSPAASPAGAQPGGGSCSSPSAQAPAN